LQEKEEKVKTRKQILGFATNDLGEKKLNAVERKVFLESTASIQSSSLPIFGISSSYTGKATLFLFKDLGLPSIIVAAIADIACHIILARGLLVLALGIVQAILSSMVK